MRDRVLNKNSCIFWSKTQPPPPPPTHTHTTTHCPYILYVYFWEGWGRSERRLEGQQFTRGVENTNMTDCISSLLTLSRSRSFQALKLKNFETFNYQFFNAMLLNCYLRFRPYALDFSNLASKLSKIPDLPELLEFSSCTVNCFPFSKIF